jgi:pimeloyl-ACP methyl ester carboxylesterase
VAGEQPRLIFLHGIPIDWGDPFRELDGLLAHFGEHERFDWRSESSPLQALRDARKGTLGQKLAAPFERYLSNVAGPVVLVGYSAGGWTIYEWLARRSASSGDARVEAVVTIGAPWRRLEKELFLPGHEDRSYTFDPWPGIPPQAIYEGLGRPLRRGPARLLAVCSSGDLLVPPANAVLPTAAAPFRNHIVDAVAHQDLASHHETVEEVVDFLQPFLEPRGEQGR